jgi:2-polyprenyl-6-methoxyphenol hydroxylase-like FAD-dependent oxidoreductase
VLIVGGGVGGMSAAIRLGRLGMQVDVVELSWKAIGAGLTLNGATLRALETLGVLHAVLAQGYGSKGTSVMCAADGTVEVESIDSRPFGPKIPVIGGILRPVLHEILQAATLAAGATVRTELTVDRLDQSTPGQVVVTFSDGGQGTYDLVLGADGLFSKVRGLIMPDAAKPAFTGQGCWRAVVPRPPEVQTPYVFLNGERKAGFNPVTSDLMYLYLLVSAPGNPWIEPDTLNERLKLELAGFGGYIAAIRDGLNSRSLINYRPLESIMLPSPWYRGRVLLIGDAAHATTPHVGYGAGLAIEDGVVLGDILESSQDIDAALPAFMARRYERCRAVVEGSVDIGRMEQESAPPEDHKAAMTALMKVVQSPI